MTIGFTGTQQGMTRKQKRALTNLLDSCKPTSFHHGDCIGADEEAHYIAQKLGIPIVIHPPSKSAKRAFCKGWKKMCLPKDYEDRNKDIVLQTDLLVGCPATCEEEVRSGTWSTIRFAWYRTLPVRILDPYAC